MKKGFEKVVSRLETGRGHGIDSRSSARSKAKVQCRSCELKYSLS